MQTTDTYFLPDEQLLVESQPRQCGHFIINCLLSKAFPVELSKKTFFLTACQCCQC